MLKTLTVLIIGLIFIVAGNVSSASASTPTPTPFVASPSPTLLPINPTATSPWQYMRPTPTPFTIDTTSIAVNFNLDMGNKADNLADSTINFYQFFNLDGKVDLAVLLAMAFILIGYLIKLITSTTKDQ